MVESSNPATAVPEKGGQATATVTMEESGNSAGDDLEEGVGAGAGAGTVAEPSADVSVWTYLRWYTPRIILWSVLGSVVLWMNIAHLVAFGPWSELAFFLVATVPLLVLFYLAGRQPSLVAAPVVEQEEPMMPADQVQAWEDMAVLL